jgi:hypothetical protein
MKKALISPNELVKNPNTGVDIGIRIAQVADNEFEVAIPLYWIECPDNTDPGTQYYDEATQEIKQIPVYVITAEQNKEKAATLLQQTDWVVLSDVDDANLSPHLANKAEFISYRSILRDIAVNPVPGNINWPTKPQEQWIQ